VGEQRRVERVAIALPVDLPAGVGRTRDMSSDGAYIVTDHRYDAGASLEFAVRFEHVAGSPLWLRCEGRVVRVERIGAEFGLAVAIRSHRLEPEDRSEP
jgi:hypothetical protein